MDTPAPKRQPNRRSSMRRPARQTIRMQCRKGAHGLGPNVALGMSNISETGVQLIAKVQLAAGDELEVLLEGHGMRQPIRRLARVRWAVPMEDGSYRVGVHFDKLLTFRDLQSLAIP
jgi:PilZ domain